jgi:hypothetical protein
VGWATLSHCPLGAQAVRALHSQPLQTGLLTHQSGPYLSLSWGPQAVQSRRQASGQAWSLSIPFMWPIYCGMKVWLIRTERQDTSSRT